MNWSRTLGRVFSGCMTFALAWSMADAQTSRGGSNANVQLLQQVQQLGSERTALQAELERTKKDLADIKKDRDALKASQQTLLHRAQDATAAVTRSASQRQNTEQELAQSKSKMQELIAKFRETLQTMRELETEKATAKQSVAMHEQELKVCVDHNQALYKLNDEVLTRFDKQSLWSRVASAEPFTHIKRVQLENLIDDYKSRSNDQRVTPESLKAAAAVAPPSGAPRPPAAASPSASAGAHGSDSAAPSSASGTAPPKPDAQTPGKQDHPPH